MVVLEAEQLLHVLHVAEVWPGGLLRNHHMGQQELILGLRGGRWGERLGRREGDFSVPIE